MSNEVGTTLLNSLTNSTFDIGNMSKVLAESEVAGPKAILERNREETSTELNALNYLQSNMSAFKSYVQDLSNPDTFTQATASSSDESVFTANLTGVAANGSYQIEARQLAQSNTQVVNKIFASPAEEISSGTLNISIGGNNETVTVDASNNTLEGLQRTINNGDYGVNASVINTGNGYQLMFSSKETGASSEMQISGLADIDTEGLTTTSVAQDAIMSVNGLMVSNSSNTFDEVIPGLEIDLKSAQPGVTQSLNVSQDSEGVVEKVEAFVDVFNQLDTIFDELGSYEELTDEQKELEEYAFWGDLSGSSLLKQVRQELESSLSGAIDELNSDYNSLAVIGITINRDGEMELDKDKLQSTAELGLDNLQNIFAKGGYSEDPLINVIGGSDKTQTGNYSIDITQVAQRASTTGLDLTPSGDQKVAGARVFDQEAVLELQNSSFDLNGTAVNFTAQSFDSKEALTTYMQSQIDTAITGAGGASGDYLLAYDSGQARFELTAADTKGAVALDNVTGLANQGFTQSAYTGEGLVNLAGGTLDFSVDASEAASINVEAGRFTLSEIADNLRTSINNNTEVQAAGAEVSVIADGNALSLSSNRFGGNSKIDITGGSGLAELGLSIGTSNGQNVDGTLTMSDGSTLNIGAYANSEDGRKVTISDFAIDSNDGEAAARGLSFEVLGGAIGARDDMVFAQGFASRLEDTITNYFEDEAGLVTQRLESLDKKTTEYEEKQEKIDARYDKYLMKYQLQFSALQSILSNSEQTRSMLSSTFSNGD